MQIRNALQIRNGDGKVDVKKGFNSFTQPIQFLSKSEKDADWAIHNLDWLEWQGIKQISRNAPRLMKNYNLAKGTIDRSDYIPDEQINDTAELIDIIDSDYINEQNTDSAMELKFYPIIPNVINVLVAEFAKRNTKVDFRAEDEYSYSEIFNAKLAEVEAALLEDAQAQLVQAMLEMGMDPNSQEAQQELDPEALKRLPQIEDFYSKTYQTIGEQWAAKQHVLDVNRFHMDELEEIGFRDMLVTDREFWHFRLMENDYKVDLWNPVLTFYHKSPTSRYISEGSWVGNIDMLTISDVIDLYGPILNQEQLEELESLHPVRAGRYLDSHLPNDGSYYNSNISHDKNLDPSLNMKKWLSYNENAYDPDDIVAWIIGQSEHHGILYDQQMLRVTTAYWKSQRKVGYLTSIDEGGNTFHDIVDEDYVVSNNPIYQTKFDKRRTPKNLVFGDHIEWVWINQTYGGVKIGPNRIMFQDSEDKDSFSPIYIGAEQNEIGPLRFQFKGEESLYGCKLPVEGKVFTERNTKSTSLVDLMKPAQIGFNLVNNQIADILIDEQGTVILLDQNALPKHSLGEDWGKGNYAKAYAAMNEFGILPLDTSIANTENALNFAHFQKLDLEQSNRLMSRMQMAQFFKNQALEVIGMTPQRMGQQIGQKQTATEVEQSVVGSYAQTEMYFIQHSDYLMPRVHQMRTDVAQYYHSKADSIKMLSSLTQDERKFFEINGVDLLMIDINVFCKTNANHRAVMEQIQQIIMTNNTMGSSMYEIGEVMNADSLGSLNNKLREMDTKAQERAQQEHQQELEKIEKENEAKRQEKQMANDHDKLMLESKNRNNLLVAQVRSAGYGAMQDIDENKVSDFQDVLKQLHSTQEYQDTMNLKKTQEDNKMSIGNRKLDIEQQKVDVARETSQNQLKVAKENQTKAEINAKKGKKNEE
jgi:hypothetical protein